MGHRRLNGSRLHAAVAASLLLTAGMPAVRTHAQSGTPTQAAAPTPGLRRELVGVVRNHQGALLEGVAVDVYGSAARSDVRGAFRLSTADTDTVTLLLRHVGFEPVSAVLTARNHQWDTVLVQMVLSTTKLSGVRVRAPTTRTALGLRNFETRRAGGHGVFVTREQIVDRNTSRMSDLLRDKRGISVVRGRVRFVSSTGRGALCIPDLWLDGTRAKGMEVDEILPSDVEAIELYAHFSTVPFEFTPMSSGALPCGTIVVWTRIPNGRAR